MVVKHGVSTGSSCAGTKKCLQDTLAATVLQEAQLGAPAQALLTEDRPCRQVQHKCCTWASYTSYQVILQLSMSCL
jgi:hypothetical protein